MYTIKAKYLNTQNFSVETTPYHSFSNKHGFEQMQTNFEDMFKVIKCFHLINPTFLDFGQVHIPS